MLELIKTLWSFILNFFKPSIVKHNKAGDMIFRAGDGGQGGDGGNLTVGPGNYKAGDAIQQSNNEEKSSIT